MSWYRKNKYNSSSCKCVAGHIHHSRKEAEYCTDLYYLKKAGEIKDYKTQVNFDLKVNGNQVCRHIVDFTIEDKAGVVSVAEVKGFATDIWALKHKLFKAVYPDIEYKVIK